MSDSSLLSTLAMLQDPATVAWMDPDVWGPDIRTRYQPLTAATLPVHDESGASPWAAEGRCTRCGLLGCAGAYGNPARCPYFPPGSRPLDPKPPSRADPMPEDQMAVAHRRYYKAKAAMENVVRAIDALLAMDHNRVPLKLAAQLTATSDGLKAECDHIVAVWD